MLFLALNMMNGLTLGTLTGHVCHWARNIMNTISLLELTVDLVTPGGENSKLQLVFNYSYNCCARWVQFPHHSIQLQCSLVSLYIIYFTLQRRDSTGTRHRLPLSDDSLLKSSANNLNLTYTSFILLCCRVYMYIVHNVVYNVYMKRV